MFKVWQNSTSRRASILLASDSFDRPPIGFWYSDLSCGREAEAHLQRMTSKRKCRRRRIAIRYPMLQISQIASIFSCRTFDKDRYDSLRASWLRAVEFTAEVCAGDEVHVDYVGGQRLEREELCALSSVPGRASGRPDGARATSRRGPMSSAWISTKRMRLGSLPSRSAVRRSRSTQQIGPKSTPHGRILDAYGRLDGVVDIVGASFGASLLEADRISFAATSIQSLSGDARDTSGAAAIAKNGSGTVVLIGSSAGLSSLPNQIMYGSAKAALHHASIAPRLNWSSRGSHEHRCARLHPNRTHGDALRW